MAVSCHVAQQYVGPESFLQNKGACTRSSPQSNDKGIKSIILKYLGIPNYYFKGKMH
jgi:hypothetical protein